MKKLKLNLQEIMVASFETTKSKNQNKGTVVAQGIPSQFPCVHTEYTCEETCGNNNTCGFTCNGTCLYQTCVIECPDPTSPESPC